MEYSLAPALVELQKEATAFGRTYTTDLDIREDSWLRALSTEFAEAMGRRGWLGMTWPTEMGGGGQSPLERFVVVEALISQGAPLASCWFADRQIGPTILAFGTDQQKRSFLPEIIAGNSAWCIGMSEPDSGSDVASLTTRAELNGKEWVLNGAKVWTSGAAHADWCYVIARTDPDAPKHRGLSEFIVDLRSPGIEIQPIRDMTHDAHFCEVRFDDVAVPETMRVGELNGAFGQIISQMEHERGGIDRLVSNRALYVDVVATYRDHISSNATLRDRFARLEGGYQLGRLMVLREVIGQAPRGFSAVTKTWCTEFEQEVAQFCADVLGPATMLSDVSLGLSGRVARNICYAPGYTIMGGTTEILRNIRSERLLGLPR